MIFNDNLTINVFDRVPVTLSLNDFLMNVTFDDGGFHARGDNEYLTPECIESGCESMFDYAIMQLDTALQNRERRPNETELAKQFLKIYADWFDWFYVSFDNFGDYVDFEIITDKYGHVDRIVKLSCCNV